MNALKNSRARFHAVQAWVVAAILLIVVVGVLFERATPLSGARRASRVRSLDQTNSPAETVLRGTALRAERGEAGVKDTPAEPGPMIIAGAVLGIVSP